MWVTYVLQCLAILVLGLKFYTLGEETAFPDLYEEKQFINKEIPSKIKKVLPVFEIVRFSNDPCNGTGSTQGTCYTAEECSNLGGSASGSCAQGYGVCCVFSLTCGQSTKQNCSFFTSSGITISNGMCCTLEVCPCNDNICQLRLDFNQFSINQPESGNAKNVFLINGCEATATAAIPASSIINAVPATIDTRCTVDSFSVSSPGSTAPPVICGTNTNEHMYVEASDCCNNLSFNFGTAANGGSRSFNIKVTQYSCDYNNLAPSGCTKYFFGTTSDQVKSYNFPSSQLADQREKICVRREAGMCQICWSPNISSNDIFDVSGNSKNGMRAGISNMCCGQGLTSGGNMVGFDCVVIPGASNNANLRLYAENFCGGGQTLSKSGFFLGSDGNTGAGRNPMVSVNGPLGSVCSRKLPFVLSYYTDSYETVMEQMNENNMATAANYNNLGFQITYTMMSC